ncbi:MAG: Na(+)/H(+) antiporter subunit E [Syntrophomonadaceae bacterium]|nr:Na(+)/H(+) antiporter subunit E [Candidatus Psychracetigena formicireducens]MBT9138280.1 Na(+)/H(+) antiporter subunit E [Bacillota bacterium]
MKNIKGLRNSLPVFLILFAFWILLSGRSDGFHLTAGALSSLLVTLFSRKLLLDKPTDRGSIAIEVLRIIRYSVWLIYQIIISGIDVAKRTLKPVMPIYPGIIKCKLSLKSDIALTLLANSITLTPGTMTVDISGDEIFIHCLEIEDEQKLIESEMNFENHIKRMLGYKEYGDKK